MNTAFSRPDSSGVWFPPPIWYAFDVIGGYLLHLRWPLAITPAALAQITGVVIGLAGAVLAISGVAGFSRAKTSRVPIRPATSLVTSGPYALTRNPMYLGLAFATAGCGLLLMTWWPIILLVPTLVIIQQFVIIPEEQYLQRRFGNDYASYARRVRRWL